MDTSHLALALLHSLWQGALVFCLVRMFLLVVSERRAEARYWASMGGLVLVWLLTVGTYSWLEYDAPLAVQETVEELKSVAPSAAEGLIPSETAVEPEQTAMVPEVLTSAPESAFIPTYSNFESGMPSWETMVCLGWYAGVFFMLMRMLFHLRATARFQGSCAEATDARVLEDFRALRIQMRIRKGVRLLLHATLSQPAALGFLRPAVVLPMGALTGLNEEQLGAVLAHELAHIRRHDYVFTLAQMLVEALLFFNPFVWVLGRTVRLEREACCDRLASDVLGDVTVYTRSLLDAVEVFSSAHVPILNTLGADKSSGFRNRIRRLVLPDTHGGSRMRWTGLVTAGLVIGGVIVGVSYLTHHTVSFTAQLLTPEERVEQIAALEAETQGPIGIEGRVVDEDGNPITERLNFRVRSSRTSLSESRHNPDGHFNIKNPSFGSVTIGVSAAGYAPSYVGPISGKAESVVRDIEIVLHRGVTNTVRVENEAGVPLEGIEVSGGHESISVGYSGTFHTTTDQNGEFQVLGSPEIPIKLSLTTLGYQSSRKTILVNEGTVHAWVLKRARVVKGVVRSATTGMPVSNATIKHVARRKSGNNGNSGHSFGTGVSSILTTTNIQGEFQITTFEPDMNNTILVEADGYGLAAALDVTDQSPLLEIELPWLVSLSGTINLPNDLMPSVLAIGTRIKIGENHYQLFSVLTEVVDGAFHFSDLSPGEWEFEATDDLAEKRITLDYSLSGLVLTGHAATETIRLTLSVPENHPLPNGEIVLTPYYLVEDVDHTYHRGVGSKRVSVVDGVAFMEIPIDSAQYTFKAHTEGLYPKLPPAKPYEYERSKGLPGYYLPDQTIHRLESSEYASSLSVACLPAGAVRVRVLDTTGEPLREVGSVNVVVKAPRDKTQLTGHFDGNNHRKKSGDATLFTSLPLGEAYQFTARVGELKLTSPVIRLTEKNPIVDVTLRAESP